MWPRVRGMISRKPMRRGVERMIKDEGDVESGGKEDGGIGEFGG